MQYCLGVLFSGSSFKGFSRNLKKIFRITARKVIRQNILVAHKRESEPVSTGAATTASVKKIRLNKAN